MKQELNAKLEEFITPTDSLEEVFENREQIEISKFYERLPKPHSVALAEMGEGILGIEEKEGAEDDAEGSEVWMFGGIDPPPCWVKKKSYWALREASPLTNRRH